MRQIRQVLRLHLEAGLTYAQVGRALGMPKSTVGKFALLARAAGVDWTAAQGLGDEELQARAVPAGGAACSAPPRARLRLHPPGAQAPGRDAAVAVGGVLVGQRAGLQVHELLHQVPRVGREPEALDAPSPRSRRQALRRLRRPDGAHHRRGHRRDPHRADLRGNAGCVELHLRPAPPQRRRRSTGSARSSARWSSSAVCRA